MITKIIALFKIYKWLLLPVIPMFILLGFIIYLFSSPLAPAPSSTPSIETQPSISQPTAPEQEDLETEFDEGLELRSNFQKKEVKSDGTTQYFFDSGNSNRPDIIILTKDKNLVFSRSLSSEELPIIPMSLIREDFGEPEKTIQGSKFYGPQSSIYVYSSSGVTFIGNVQTDETFEEQRFPSMSVDAYLQRFGDQN